MKKIVDIVFKCSLKDTHKLHCTSSHTCRPILILCRSVSLFNFLHKGNLHFITWWNEHFNTTLTFMKMKLQSAGYHTLAQNPRIRYCIKRWNLKGQIKIVFLSFLMDLLSSVSIFNPWTLCINIMLCWAQRQCPWLMRWNLLVDKVIKTTALSRLTTIDNTAGLLPDPLASTVSFSWLPVTTGVSARCLATH